MATILIVDDRPPNRELLVTLLGYTGHRPLEAADGEEGLSIARAERPDLIITDIVMPKMDGYEFARQVRADPSISNTQIIFYTSSYIVSETRNLAAACGVSIVIGKPIEPAEFLEQVRIALATKPASVMSLVSDDFHSEHMRLLTDTLVHKVEELEAEIAERKQAEKALLESERTLKLFVDHAPAAIAMFDRNMQYIAASRRYLADYGLGEQNIIGRSHYEIFPEVSERWKEIYRRCLEGAMEKAEEDPFPRADGIVDWVQWEIHPWYEKTGEIGGILLFSEVITERIRSTELLNYHARLLRHINDAVIATDEQSRITAWNRAAEKMYGWRSEEVMGHNLSEILTFELTYEERIAAGEILKESTASRSERIYHHRDGRTIYVEANTIALLDQQGRMTGYVSVDRDITERKLTEEALAQSNDLLSRAEQLGHIGSWEWDISANQVVWSDGLFAVFGLTRGEFGATYEAYLNCVHPDDREYVRQTIEATFGKPEALEYECRILRPDGQIRALYARAEVILNNQGAPAQLLGIGMDITERKRAEQQTQLQLQRVRALRAIDIAISSSFDLNLTLNLLLDQVIAQLNTDAAAILLFHPVTRTLEHAASRGFRSTAIPQVRLQLGEGYAGKAILERRIIHIPNLVETDSELNYALSLKTENFMGYYGLPLIVKGEVKGVLEIFHRSALAGEPEWLDFLETLAGQAAIAIDSATLFEDLQHSNRELFQAYDATIEGWSHALDLRDKETEGHSRRVTEMTLKLARKFDFTDEQLRYLRWGALLHDIGKMGVPDYILLKPDKLTDEEWDSMKKHPDFAFQMLSPIAYLKSSLDIPYCHHEKWDGTGYPRGLKGEVIPLAARLFAIVDVWDALRSDRPYRYAWTAERTREHIQSLSGTHFDPQVVKYFLEMIG